MKVLFITRGSLVGNNNSGNTIINIFSGMKNIEFNNLFFRSEAPNKKLCDISCQVSEVSLANKLKNGTDPVSVTYKDTDCEVVNSEAISNEKKVYGKAKQNNSYFLWFAREILWDLGAWKNKTLNKFIEEVNPELIFMPAYGCLYPYKVLKYVHSKCPDVPVFVYHFDDNYSLKRHSYSPLFWLYRFKLRRNIRMVEAFANKTYVISDVQKEEYEKAFNTNCQILTKGNEYIEDNKSALPSNPIPKLCYTGNLGNGRLDILLKIAKVLAQNNSGKLDIYSASIVSNDEQKQMESISSISFHGAISPEQVKEVQEKSDILIHVEDFSEENKLLNRHSISTKIFDYMNIPRCIIAVGPSGIASIDFLKEKDAAVIIDNVDDISLKLADLLSDKEKISSYANKAWECGKNNFDITKIRASLQADIDNAVKGK